MAKVVCSVCKRLMSVTSEEWSYLDPQLPVCSRECVLEWIVSQDGELEGDYMDVSDWERADEAFSDKLKMWFRSLYERFFAEAVADEGLSFSYERYAFRLSSTSIYVPDFFFPEHGCFVEVKGKWGVGAKTKIRTFRRLYKTIPLLVVPWVLRDDFYPSNQPCD